MQTHINILFSGGWNGSGWLEWKRGWFKLEGSDEFMTILDLIGIPVSEEL